jgi:uracil-DNA glycosylase family 4
MAPCSIPGNNCKLCPRLAAFRHKNRALYPDKFNAPVPAFGANDPQLLVVGLAPGLKGANFSGRPFTGDYAGDLLYPTLLKFGFARGDYGRCADDGFALVDARVTNAVRCVPPENKPTGDEINTCRTFLESELSGLSRLKVIIALGGIAHNSVLRALGLPVISAKFGHKKHYPLTPKKSLRHPVLLIDSYHCSRYNVNTRRLTTEMFEDVVVLARRNCK